jgi:CHASE2 domain-containing sensor protein
VIARSSSTVSRRLFLLGTAAALGFATLVSGAGEGLDHLLRSARDAARARDASGQIHLVEIDRRSLSAIDRWPWPRSVHGRAVDRLREAGVHSIAFDVEFSAPSEPDQDAAFAAALERAGGSVVLPAIRQSAGAGRSDYIDTDVAKPFQGKAFLAAVNVIRIATAMFARCSSGWKRRASHDLRWPAWWLSKMRRLDATSRSTSR